MTRQAARPLRALCVTLTQCLHRRAPCHHFAPGHEPGKSLQDAHKPGATVVICPEPVKPEPPGGVGRMVNLASAW